MTKDTNAEAKDNVPGDTNETAIDQPREQLEQRSTTRRASEVQANIHDQPQTNDMSNAPDPAIDTAKPNTTARMLARALAAIESASRKVDLLTANVNTISRTQAAMHDDLRKLQSTSKKRHDCIKVKIDGIESTLACVHEEFHVGPLGEDDMRLVERLEYFEDELSGEVQAVSELREGFELWRVAERADRRILNS